jgi:hypothetical protein
MSKSPKWARRLVKRLREEYRRKPPTAKETALDRALAYEFRGRSGQK